MEVVLPKERTSIQTVREAFDATSSNTAPVPSAPASVLCVRMQFWEYVGLEEVAMTRERVILLALILSALGCGTNDPRERGLQIVYPLTAMLPLHVETLAVAVNGVQVDRNAVSWSIDTDTAGEMVAPGVIRAVAPGRLLVTASANGYHDTLELLVFEPVSGVIAFVGISEALGGTFKLLQVDLSTGNVSTFANTDISNPGPPSYSPDGGMIAVPLGNPPHVLVRTSDWTTQVAQVDSALGCGSSQPAWAPDSRSLAFVSCAGGGFDVWTYSLSTRVANQISSFQQSTATSIAFGSTGDQLIVSRFVHNPASSNPQEGQVDLYAVDLTGDTTRLTATPANEMSPFVDPGSTGLFFTRNWPNGAPPPDGFMPNIVRASETLTAQEALITTKLFDITGRLMEPSTPKLSPEKAWVVFELRGNLKSIPGHVLGTNAGGFASNLFLLRLSDRRIAKLTHEMNAGDPSWKP